MKPVEPSPIAVARALLDAGRYDDAEAALAEIAAAGSSESLEAGRTLGHVLLQRGAWAAAQPYLEVASKAEGPTSAAAFDLAWCQFHLGDLGAAAETLRPMAGQQNAALLRGRALLELGQASDALPVLADCGLPAADLPAGWCHLVLGHPERAAACWERWMRAGAADWGTKDALAMFLFLLGGGQRPCGRPERPAEPLRDMDRWFRLLVRYGRATEVSAALRRGPELDPAFWQGLRARWKVTLEREGHLELAATLE